MQNRLNRPIYLDCHATTPCDPRVLEAMLPWFTERFGNPHSAEHAFGREAEQAVETARAEIAALIGADAREIVLTSGATEANNLAIKGAARFAAEQGDERRRFVTLATEHKCVLESAASLRAEGFDVVVLPVRGDGLLDLAVLEDALRTPTLLVSAMAANNETGVLHDLAAIGARTRAAGALLHTDAAQAAGKVPLDVQAMNVDLLSISGHKMYGPKGIGALYVRRRPRVRLAPLFSGGGQERGLRSGTVPAPLAVGLGVASRIAAEALREGEPAQVAALRDLFLARLRARIPDLRLNGHPAMRLAGNLNLTFPAGSAQALMAAAPDLCLSTGSACSSAEIVPSYVLRALGVSDGEAGRTLRIGIGRFTSRAEIEAAAEAIADAHAAVAAAPRADDRARLAQTAAGV